MGNSIILPPDYVPNKKEEYMNEMQLEYFRQKLLDWKKTYSTSPAELWKTSVRAA